MVPTTILLPAHGLKVDDNPHLTTTTRHVMVGITRSKVISASEISDDFHSYGSFFLIREIVRLQFGLNILGKLFPVCGIGPFRLRIGGILYSTIVMYMRRHHLCSFAFCAFPQNLVGLLPPDKPRGNRKVVDCLL